MFERVYRNMNIFQLKKSTIDVIFVLLLWGLMVLFPSRIFCVLLVVCAFLFLLKKHGDDLFLPKLILAALLFQNTINGIGMHITGDTTSTGTSLLSQIPTLFVLIGSSLVILKNGIKKVYVFFILYVLFLITYCFVGDASFTSRIYYVRNFVFFYLVFLIGKYTIDSERKFQQFIDYYISLAFISGLFGLVAFMFDNKPYIPLGVREIYVIKNLGSDITLYYDGLPGTFVTSDFFGLGQTSRIASFFFEPINFSFFLALALLLVLYRKKTNLKIFLTIFFSICILFTFGKGGMMVVGLSIAEVFVGSYVLRIKGVSKKKFRKIVIGLTVIGVAILGISVRTIFVYNPHFIAINQTFNAIIRKPMGYGIGTAGNISMMSTLDSSLVGRETGLLNFMYQIGVIGIGLFLALIISISKETINNWKSKNEKLTVLFVAIPIILTGVFLFQENVFTPQVIAGYMLAQGYFASYSDCANVCGRVEN